MILAALAALSLGVGIACAQVSLPAIGRRFTATNWGPLSCYRTDAGGWVVLGLLILTIELQHPTLAIQPNELRKLHSAL